VIRAMAKTVSAKVVASGGAGKLEHFYDAVTRGPRFLLAASVFHFRIIENPRPQGLPAPSWSQGDVGRHRSECKTQKV
jgi:hypothetical protein